ncbi:MspA family porin [Rhodococcus maanshanensis]|uniref:MspA family porin n=1 Tax=Rhodococcus TaxID=1827 RepID=UPI000BD4DAEE|nr:MULTISPECIES: MspA family porin [Rhodococcus]MCZ4556307.1 MspA family porin [Rhodococcus maanshanensis]SNX91465.1 MspA protein [Rhodococcus sp. OK270]
MNSSTIGLRRGLRISAVGAATAIAVGFLSAGAANADTFVPLPGGTITKTLADGTVVTVTMTGESANISGSMGATPLHRNVWVSGSAKVEISGGSGAEGGYIEPGYVVACQLTLGGEAGGESGMGAGWDGTAGEPEAATAGNVSIGPGEAASFSVLDLESADDFGGESHSGEHSFEGATGSVTWADSTMGVEGCAGYAQARSYVNVTVDTENVKGTVTLWGQPFSIG